jgi:predicted O-linked N-acetylglucosamine transferase (SPINDLY family)
MAMNTKQGQAMLAEAGRLMGLGKFSEAEGVFRQVAAADPASAAAQYGLGLIAAAQDRLDEAVALYRRALELAPQNSAALVSLGQALTVQGEFVEAEAFFLQALRVSRRNADATHGLGVVATRVARLDAAIERYRAAIALKPDQPVFHTNLGNALRDLGRHGEAIEAYRQSLALWPRQASVHSFLGVSRMLQGGIDEGLAEFDRALMLDPSYVGARSNKLLCLNYSDRSPAEIFAEHRRWDAAYGLPLPSPASFRNDRRPVRLLKIGYVSGDFRQHPVAAFLAPLLEQHDRFSVQIHCYAEVERPDAVTARFQRLADRWFSTVGVPDDAVADRIRADEIDILVDLAGHTAGSRLGVFARKPAPIQVSWLGYPNTTGLAAMDYRLVDAITDPPGEADAFASEQLVRLDDGFLCYGPPADARPVSPPPCLAKGHVTFGSFNAFTKLSGPCLDAWAAILAAVPGSRLLLRGGGVSEDAAARERIVQRLGAPDVTADRLDFLGFEGDPASHLARYANVDVALDPFPYNGATTTCEALWMGVPVVTLRGARHAGRVGASLLTRVGREDLIAEDVAGYVATATRLAADPAGLAAARAIQREQMAASPLRDAGAFAARAEDAFRTMRAAWLEGGGRA